MQSNFDVTHPDTGQPVAAVKNDFLAAFSVSSEIDPADLLAGGFKKGKLPKDPTR